MTEAGEIPDTLLEKYMKLWDAVRKYFKNGDSGASHPRECVESWISDAYSEGYQAGLAAGRAEGWRKLIDEATSVNNCF